MLPSQSTVEPNNFDADVRQPGNAFLAVMPNPVDNDWKGKEYWRKSLPDLKVSYNSICNYCSTWIPHSTGSHSIDHFIAKNAAPNLAYEWSNFRYVSIRFNSRKRLSTIVDPFGMQSNWFIIDFANFFVSPNVDFLNEQQQLLAIDTIKILHFNDDEELVKERITYYEEYISNHISFEYLQRRAPFLAFEINRQNMRIQ